MKKNKGGKKWPAVRERDLEKRLVNAYSAGEYDGRVDGIKEAHEGWLEVLEKTKGIGPKMRERIMETVIEVMANRYVDRVGPADPDVEAVREALADA